jgi:hypothetical protein
MRLLYLGAQLELTVALPDGQRVLALVPEPSPVPLAVGQTIRVTLPADGFVVL